MQTEAPDLEVLFTPADFAVLADRDLSDTACVVFDVLRATSSIVTALANGAAAVIPVSEIPEALEIRHSRPEVLLAGERNGFRIGAALTGGIEFDLGNSPREFTPERVRGTTIVLSTTNGSRALRACASAKLVLAACFLNLSATAALLRAHSVRKVLLICSGTFEQAAYEDVLGAGALADLIWPPEGAALADSAIVARQIYERHQGDLPGGIGSSRNGRRLLSIPELRDDVAFCARRDANP